MVRLQALGAVVRHDCHALDARVRSAGLAADPLASADKCLGLQTHSPPPDPSLLKGKIKNLLLLLLLRIILITIKITTTTTTTTTIINLKKQLLLLKKNHIFDLKGEIKNYKNLGHACLILLLIL